MIDRHKNDNLKQLANFMTSLSSQYTSSEPPKEANFAFGIVQSLLQNLPLLNYLSKRNKKELADCLQIHSDIYITMFKKDETLAYKAIVFQENINNLAGALKKAENQPVDKVDNEELEIITELVTKIARKCQLLFADYANNQTITHKLQALALTFHMPKLSAKQQIQLAEKLLLVKELWQVSDFGLCPSDNFKLLLHTDPSTVLQDFKFASEEEVFEQFVTFLILEHQALHELSDNRLVELYDRLKNIDPHNSFIFNLLQQIHLEAQFRYNHNRLSDSGYELLKRFQSYDTIIHQIENSEFTIAEAFLLKRNNFIHETIRAIAKHIDNIKAIGTEALEKLHNILYKINAELPKAKHHYNIDIAILPSIQAKLAESLGSQILKRYSDLDKFTTAALDYKYTTLFDNINQLLENNVDTIFLKNVLIRKLAQDYYLNIRPNSVHKLRSMIKERELIAKQLEEIEFLEILNPENGNSTAGLNFRKLVPNNKNKTATEYVSSIIQALVAGCTAAQLETLYKSLLTEELSQTKATLKQEIIYQVQQRTTIPKLIYAVFVGRKQEFDKLRAIKNNLNEGTAMQSINGI